MADPQPERKDENVSATTPDQPNPTNVPGVPPGPPEAHRQAGIRQPSTPEFSSQLERRIDAGLTRPGANDMTHDADEFLTDAYEILGKLCAQVRTGRFTDTHTAAYVAAHPHRDEVEILRAMVERTIVACAVASFLGAGHVVRLHDGQRWATPLTSRLDVIMAPLMATGEETLYVRSRDGEGCVGAIRFIYGDRGWNVLGEYDDELIPLLAGALALAASLRQLMSAYFS